MSRNKILLIIVFVVIVWVAVMVTWESQLIHNSSFDYKDPQGKINSLSDVDVKFNLIFSNESHLSFDITGGNLSVFVDGNYVTKVDKFSKVRINANDANVIPIAFNINPTAVYKQEILPNINMLGNVPVTIKGTLQIRKGLVFFNYPVDETFTLSELMS